jgi:hypothetical protein
MNADELAQWIVSFVTQVKNQTGIMPLLYCQKYYAQQLYKDFQNGIIPCKLWIATNDAADPAGSPQTKGWESWPWIFQQFNQAGTINGISGNVDIDYFPGDAAALNALVNGTSNVTPTIDLTITAGTPNASPSTLAAGSAVTVSCAESNNGNSAAGANNVTVWLSTDNQLETNTDQMIGQISFGSVTANSESLINSSTITIPPGTAPGSYYLFFWADGGQVIAETNEQNNFASKVITVTAPSQPLPDLVPQNTTLSSVSVNPGMTLIASCTDKNQGGSAAAASVTSLWLCPSQTFAGAPADIYLGEIDIPALTAGQTSAVLNKQVILPTGTYAGTWYIMFGADGAGTVAESNEANNQTFVPVSFNSSTSPGAPVLTLTPKCNGSSSEVVLNWTNTSTETSYDVYRNNSVLSQGLSGTTFNNTSVTAGTNYSYYIVAHTPSGIYTSASQSATAPDCSTTTLPGTPVLSLTANCIGTTSQLLLSWTSTNNTIAYDIFKNNAYLTTVNSVTQYADNDVTGGTSYTYYVRATNGSGGTNSASQMLAAANCNIQLPGAPVLTLREGCLNGVPQIVLDWTVGAGATAYDIYRDGTYTATVSNATQYDDVNRSPNVTYSYVVKATNGAGGTNSNQASAEALDCTAILPGKPLLTVTPECNGQQGKMVLDWTVNNAILCKIYRNGVAYPDIYGTTGEFVDDQVSPGNSYTYYIQALNNVGDNNSDQVSGTTENCAVLVPAAPVLTALAACSGDTAKVSLNWTASTGAGSYDIYRNGSLYFPNVIAGTEFDDLDVTVGSTYNYYIVAKNTYGTSQSNSQAVQPVSCLQPPVVSNFKPATAMSGTTVTITGTHLENASAVSFGSIAAQSFTVISSTMISAVVGNGASGSIHITTPGGAVDQSGFTYRFNLPATNFTVYTKSATCHQDADGEIHIKSAQPENFLVQITSNNGNSDTTFTDSVVLRSLLAGIYHVCLSVKEQAGYQQCYDLAIDQPTALSVFSAINFAGRSLSLQLNGGNVYFITLNGQSYTTSDNSIDLPISSGDNQLQVTTDKPCQGSFSKVIKVDPNLVPYPDPFTNTLKLDLGSRQIQEMEVKLISISSNKTVFVKQLQQQSGIVELAVPDLPTGAYLLVVKMDNIKKSFKVLRQ